MINFAIICLHTYEIAMETNLLTYRYYIEKKFKYCSCYRLLRRQAMKRTTQITKILQKKARKFFEK